MAVSTVETDNTGERKGCALAFVSVFNRVTVEQNLEKEQTSWTLGGNIPGRENSKCRNLRQGMRES